MIACFFLEQFGVACERARLEGLWGAPLALAGADGLLAAVSDEAAAYGIRVGQKAAGARALCEGLIVLPYDGAVYELAAQSLWDLYAIESSVVEPVSPECCFVRMDGPDALERTRALAEALSMRVRVPARVGLARSKFVARQAALQSDERTVELVSPGHESAFLAHLPVSRIPGLDHKMRQRLERLGIKTVGDILALPRRRLERQFREVGFLLGRLAAGNDNDPVKPRWPPRRLEHGFCFEEEVVDLPSLHYALRQCAEAVSGELARGREFCRTLALELRFADETCLRERERLALPVDALKAVECGARRLLQRMVIDRPVAGVCLQASELGTGSGVQLALLDDYQHGALLPHERRSSLEATLTYLRKRFGVGVIVTAAMLRQARRIGLWTYPLGHLLDEPVHVALTPEGFPARFWRRGAAREVRRIQNRWRETEWFWGSLSDRTVYRVETDPAGLCELYELGVQWRLAGIAD